MLRMAHDSRVNGNRLRPRLEPATCLFGARALRDFGDGFVAILLPVYLLSLGLTALAGAMFAASYRSWPLFLCGVLKIIYDLLLLVQFRHRKPPEER